MENKAGLQFKGYKVKSSKIEFNAELSGELQVGFEPKGKIINDEKVFILTLGVSVKDKSNHLKINVIIEGIFEFNDRENPNIENFLYLNAPAILFPYVRAYINTLTSLSGYRPILLPTLNLSGLRENLKSNTTED